MFTNHTLTFKVDPSPETGSPSHKRRRQEFAYQEWKFRAPEEVDDGQRKETTNVLKKNKERERRTKMTESVGKLRELLPGKRDQKMNQILVMNFAAEYIKKLETAVSLLHAENSAFRDDYMQRSMELPANVNHGSFQMDLELTGGDEDNSDNLHEEAHRPPSRTISPSLPFLNLNAVNHASSLFSQSSMSEFNQYSTSEQSQSVPTSTGNHIAVETEPLPTIPIPIPGTVGAPIRPHEPRTRLERVTGSSQHLVNKNPRKKSPETFNADKRNVLSYDDHRHLGELKENSGGPSGDVDMMEAIEFLQMPDIEEVPSSWQNFGNACNDPSCSNYLENHTHSMPTTANSSLSGLKHISSFESPIYYNKNSLFPSPKLIFNDSPNQLETIMSNDELVRFSLTHQPGWISPNFAQPRPASISQKEHKEVDEDNAME